MTWALRATELRGVLRGGAVPVSDGSNRVGNDGLRVGTEMWLRLLLGRVGWKFGGEATRWFGGRSLAAVGVGGGGVVNEGTRGGRDLSESCGYSWR